MHVLTGVRRITPPTLQKPEEPKTPRNIRSLQAMDRLIRRGEITPRRALVKTRRALEGALAEKVLLERDLVKKQAASAMEKAARSSGKRQRYPQGHLFDQKYQEEHAPLEIGSPGRRDSEQTRVLRGGICA